MDFLTLEDGTDRLSRNIVMELPLLAAQYRRRGQISSTWQRMPKVRHKMFTMSLLSGWSTQTFHAVMSHPKECISGLLCCLLVQYCFLFSF